MSAPHTPGPWFVSDDPRQDMEWNRHIATDAEGENRICFMAHGGIDKDDEFLANARLIAAAPDLLLAAKAAALAINELVKVHAFPERGINPESLFGRLVAAIKKAEGR